MVVIASRTMSFSPVRTTSMSRFGRLPCLRLQPTSSMTVRSDRARSVIARQCGVPNRRGGTRFTTGTLRWIHSSGESSRQPKQAVNFAHGLLGRRLRAPIRARAQWGTGGVESQSTRTNELSNPAGPRDFDQSQSHAMCLSGHIHNTVVSSVRGCVFALLAMLKLLIICTPLWVLNSSSLAWKTLTRKNYLKDARGERVAAAGVQHPEVEGVDHEFIEANGVRMHVARAGVGKSKPLLLFLHGFPEFWYSWRYQIEALQGDYEIAAVDMPGYNASSAPTSRSAYVTENICATIAGVVRQLGRAQCIVVAHDWGGAIAWDLAALYPELVERLAVLAAPPSRTFMKNMDLRQLTMSAYMFGFQQPLGVPEMTIRGNDYAVIREIFVNPKGGGFQRHACTDADIELYKDAIATPRALTAALNYYRAAMVEDNILNMNAAVKKARRSKLKMPVLLLWGDRDFALSLNLLTGIGAVADQIAVHVLPNCSHWIQQDAPEDVNRLLKLFASDSLPTLPKCRI